MKIKSIKLKIALTVGVLIFLSIGIITTYSIISHRQQSLQKAEEDINMVVDFQANEIQSGVNKYFFIMRTMRNIISTENKYKMISREAIIDELKKILDDNSQIIASFVQMGSNAIDNKDRNYANTDWYDASGKFIPYVYRNDSTYGIAPILEADVIDIVNQIKKDKKELFLDPYFYKVGDKNVLMVTALIPYIDNGTFIGLVGVDFPITYLQKDALDLSQKLYDGNASVSIISSQGVFAANTENPSLVGKNISAQQAKEGVQIQQILSKKQMYYTKSNLVIKMPISFGDTEKNWQIIIKVPQNKILAATRKNMFIFSVLGGILLLFSILLMIYFVKRFTDSILFVASKAQVIAKGDLTETINIESNDEIGIFVNSFNNMVLKLREIITAVKNGAEKISLQSSELSKGAGSIAQGSNEQAVTTENISSSMEEILATITSNSEKAKYTETISSKSSQELDENYKIIMRSIELVQEISKKITVISEIAGKTDILSINAAIEAARSGVTGSGFAVVAEEIRKLADKTKSASIEIEQLSLEGNKISETAGQRLKALLPEMEQSANSVTEIVLANEEQTSGVEMVSDSIQQLTMTTNENTTVAEKLSVASVELSKQAANLKNLIAIFKVAD